MGSADKYLYCPPFLARKKGNTHGSKYLLVSVHMGLANLEPMSYYL
jgi:hypothetical protein